MNPTWFALKFITALRNHEKCLYKPSIRQAIAICSLIIARFLNKGSCKVEDFIEIAVVTSPLENQALARRIATQLLSYSDRDEKGRGGDAFLSNLFFGEKAVDLLSDLNENYDELEDIFDDLEFLRQYQEELVDFDIEKVESIIDNNIFETHANDLEKEPYKTALDIIQNHGDLDVQKIKDLDSLVSMARKLLSEKINHLEPSDVLDAKNLNMLQEIIENSQINREKLLARIAQKEQEELWRDDEKKEFTDLLDTIIENLSNVKTQPPPKSDKSIKDSQLTGAMGLEDIEELDNLIFFAKRLGENEAMFTEKSQLDETMNFLDRFLSWKKKEKENIEYLYSKVEKEQEKRRLQKELEKNEKLIDAIEAQKDILNKKKENPIANKDQFLNSMEKSMRKDFNGTIQDMDFFLKSDLMDEQTKRELKDIIGNTLLEQNRTVHDLFNAATTLGRHFEFDDEEINQVIENSMDLPFKDVYHDCQNLDRYFGGNYTESYLNTILNNLNTFSVNNQTEEIKQELIKSPVKSPAWRKLMHELIERDMNEINTTSHDAKNKCISLKMLADQFISNRTNCPDLTCRLQLEHEIAEIIDKTINVVPTPELLRTIVKSFRDVNFPPNPDSIIKRGRMLGMAEEDILNLIESKFNYFKALVKKNMPKGYPLYKDSLNQLDLSSQQVEEVLQIALKGTSNGKPNFDAITCLCEKSLSDVFNSVQKMGDDALEMVLSSLGAGNGLDLLEQWFFSRHNISSKIKLKLKQIIKQIMIDLGLRSANSLIGTANAGPIVENTVIPYSLGDDFELIDLEETISSLLESGKTIEMISDEDFLVSKTSQGLRCLVLELDISGSMTGEKLAQMALCATMLVYAFKPEELALTFFESNTHKLKDLDENVELEDLVDELLDIEARGGTCIRSALEWANNQFEKKARSKYRINVLFTDADVFDFEESLEELEKIKEKDVKFVMVVPKFDYSPVMAQEMVKKVNGVLLTLNQWRDFPKLISKIISTQ